MASSGSVRHLPNFNYGDHKPEVAIFPRILRKRQDVFDPLLAKIEIPTATPYLFGSRNPIALVTLIRDADKR